MSKIIYSKYSNERDDRFKIRTSILQDELGNKKVKKTPLSKESNEHVKNIYLNYKLLSKQYEGSKISVNRCRLEKNSIEFEYIDGITLEEYLDELNTKKDYREILNLIIEYVNLIKETKNIETFKITKEFQDVFGYVNIPNNTLASKISNIDMIFSNIIISDKWYMIDYEWTFEFLVPLNYIIYRAITIYIQGSAKRNDLDNIGILKLLGISDEEILQYQKMGKGFEKYVYGDIVTGTELYKELSGETYYVKNLVEEEYRNINKYDIQIFYDYGCGFCEENSNIIRREKKGDTKGRFDILLNEGTKNIRIDPSNDNCIVKINRIVGDNGELYKIDYSTNGHEISKNTIIFITNDPQIICDNIDDNTSKIIIEMDIQILTEEMIIEIGSVLNELKIQKKLIDMNIVEVKEKEDIIKEKEDIIKEKEDIIKEKEDIIKEKEDIIKEKEDYLESIVNSRSWKLIKKIKKCIGR